MALEKLSSALWQWLAALLPAIRAAFTLVQTVLIAWHYRREGRLEARNEQLEDDRRALHRAADARRDVDHSPDGVRDDPRNRDAR